MLSDTSRLGRDVDEKLDSRIARLLPRAGAGTDVRGAGHRKRDRRDECRGPTAVAVASRRPGEPWFCFEQPERNRFAVAGIGQLTALEARGEDRFATIARMWRWTAGRACATGSPRFPAPA